MGQYDEFGPVVEEQKPQDNYDEFGPVVEEAPAAPAQPVGPAPDFDNPLVKIGKVAVPIANTIRESLASPFIAMGSKGEEAAHAKSAASLPVPNVGELKAKGLNPKAISNIIRGYQATHESLREDQEAASERTQHAAIEAAATLPTYFIGAPGLVGVGKATLGPVASGIAQGVAAGAAYGGVSGGLEAANKAAAEGKGAGEVFNAFLGGAKKEALINGGWGAVLGGLIGKSHYGGTAARELAVKQAVSTARRVSLENFTEKFQGNQILDRYKHVLAEGAAPQDMAVRIIADMYPDLATSEEGLKSAASLTTKIQRFMNASPELRVPQTPEPNLLPAREIGPEGRPMAAGLEQAPAEAIGHPAGVAPEPNVVGTAQVERPPVFAPPASAPTSPELADRLHIPPPRPIGVEGVAPLEGPPGSPLSNPLGPVETGGRPQAPPVEIAPRLEGTQQAPGIRPEPVGPTSEAPGIVQALTEAVGRSGTPEEQAALAAIKASSTRGPAEGLAKGAAPVEPRPVELPSTPEGVAQKINEMGKPNGEPGTRVANDVEYRVTASPDDQSITLHYIRNNSGRKGAASELLKKITAEADQNGVPIELDATPLPQKKGGKIPLPKLIEFYKKHGFEVVEQSENHATMRHQPTSTVTQRRSAANQGVKIAKEQGGYTFDPRTFKTYEQPGYIVTLDTKVVPKGEATGSKLISFASRYKPLIDKFKGVTVGLFEMDPEHMSMDFNIQLPDEPGNLEKAVRMGFENRQKEIGHIDANGKFTGHPTGYNPEVHGPQFTGRPIAAIRKLIEASKQLNMGI